MKSLTIRLTHEAIDTLNGIATKHASLSAAVEYCILSQRHKGAKLKAAMAQRTNPGRPGRKTV